MPQYLSPGVYVEELAPAARPIEGVGTAVAAFVGLATSGPYNTPTLVTNWSQFTATFGEFLEGSYLAHSVYGYFGNGGSVAYIVRIGAQSTDESTPVASAALSSIERGVAAYTVSALAAEGSTSDGSDLEVEVLDPTEGPSEDSFRIVVKRGGEALETFDALTTKRGRQNAVTLVNAQSTLIRLEVGVKDGSVERKPVTGSVALSRADVIAVAPTVTAQQIVGDAGDRTGFGGLETIEDITMVCVPDAVAALEQGAIDLEGFKAVQLGVIAHCELMGDRMAILDPPPGLRPQQIKDWRETGAGYDSKHATMYWPQIKVFDPLTGKNMFVPPSGHMAGIWSRSDGERGVHKAPANEVIRGAVDLEVNITRGEHDQLNPIGVNVIRTFPGRGIRVWGARTLSSDPGWRYINVRRLFNYVEDSILANLDWVVFEPNDVLLWGSIRRDVSAFLYGLWRQGALFGASSEQGYYVKCDDETNTSESIEAGYVVTEIGLAVTKPAEFVVFRLRSLPTGTSAVSE